jgi:hypothetical protein
MESSIQGSLKKGNIKLIEYVSAEGKSPSYFLQSGIVGFLMSSKDLKDLHFILNAYEKLSYLDEIEIN